MKDTEWWVGTMESVAGGSVPSSDTNGWETPFITSFKYISILGFIAILRY